MIYLLDTNVCVAYLRGKNSDKIEARLNATNPGDVALCSVVEGGTALWCCGASSRGRTIRSYNICSPASPRYRSTIEQPQPTGTLRAALETSGTPIGPNDLWFR